MTAVVERADGRRHPPPRPDYGELGARPAPPVKRPTWEWYIPGYFWIGGIAAGSWLAATAEDLAGRGDREVIRAGRYLAAGGLAAGTVLLILDLGRPERFLNMLRVVHPRSAMSLGAWGLTLFGACTGAAAMLQAAEDGLLGRRRRLARMSRGRTGLALHLAGLPPALFVGGYTGVLLASTSVPQWAGRTSLLGPLFLSSAASSGLAAVSLALELQNGRRPPARLARAEAAALGMELALAARSDAASRRLPSGRARSAAARALRLATLAGGIGLPLALQLVRQTRHRTRSRRRRRDERGPLAAGLALAGSLALRYITARDGYRSAATPADTWRLTAERRAAVVRR